MYFFGVSPRNKELNKTMKTKRSQYYFYVVLLVIISGIFLRFFMLTKQSFWYDEGMSLVWSDGESFQEIISSVLNTSNAVRFHPLYYLLLFWWRRAFGDTEFALRSLSALLGSGSIIAIFFTTLRIYGKNHALWSSLIVAFSSFCVYYSQDARTYGLLIFLASLQLYFFSKILDKKDEVNEHLSRWGFWIVTVIGLFANIFTVIFTAALCLSHIVIFRNLRQWLKWWIPIPLFSLPAILFYLIAPNATDPTSIQVTRQGLPIFQNVIFVLYGILVGTTYGPPQEQLRGEDKIQIVLGYWYHLLLLLIVVTVIVLALVITLLHRHKSSRDQRADYLFASIFVTSFFFAFLVAIVTKINWLPRHSFYLYLPIAIALPSAFKLKFPPLSQYARIAVIGLIILNIYSLSNYYFNEDYEKDDYRSAAQYLIENRDDSAQSILLWGSVRLLKYYGDNLTLDGRKLIKGNLTAEKVSNLTSNVDTVFLANNREYRLGSNPKSMIEKAMSNLYTLDSKVDFPYISIYKFVKK